MAPDDLNGWQQTFQQLVNNLSGQDRNRLRESAIRIGRSFLASLPPTVRQELEGQPKAAPEQLLAEVFRLLREE